MADHGLQGIVADLIGLPEWLPKVILRAAALVLFAIYVISPPTFMDGVSTFVDRETQIVMDRLGPLLDLELVATGEDDSAGSNPNRVSHDRGPRR